jgi:hypothetical protein
LNLDYVSSNLKFRVLESEEWDPKTALTCLKGLQTWVGETKPHTVTQAEVNVFMDMKAFAPYGMDKQGCTNIYMRLCNYIPAKSDVHTTGKALYMFFFHCLKVRPFND